MIFDVQEDRIEMWEQVAAIQVMQALSHQVAVVPGIHIGHDLFRFAGFHPAFDCSGVDANHVLKFALAARDLATSESEMFQTVLARSSGIMTKLTIKPPAFPECDVNVDTSGGIVLCPFAIDPTFRIPLTVWKATARHLRSYHRPLKLLGDRDERLDIANFSEGATLSEMPLEQKMQALASAELVVGVPNAWTWIATAWHKKIIIMHPDDVPENRWFGFYNSRALGRLLYQSRMIQIPVVLAGLRKILDLM